MNAWVKRLERVDDLQHQVEEDDRGQQRQRDASGTGASVPAPSTEAAS